jgi:hypothetical protein
MLWTVLFVILFAVYGVGVVAFAALYLYLGAPGDVAVAAAVYWPADVLDMIP